MKIRTAGLIIVAILIAAPAFAQGDPGASRADPTERGYIIGAGGFSASSATALAGTSVTSGAGGVQAGLRLAKHLLVFGEVGRISNLVSADAQTAVTTTVASLSANYGAGVTGTGQMPATYGLGGLKIQGTPRSHITPYALVGVGVAHLTPTASFAYSDGVLPSSGSASVAPTVGQDVTAQLISAGAFTQPPASSAMMFVMGAGAEVAISSHWMADLGYRYSRISADTPLHTQGLTIGFGLRF
jgi:opacity protein-like surface antigen